MSRNKRGLGQPTHEWEQIELLCAGPEQRRYEQIRPLVLFDVPVSARSEEVGLSKSTLYRRLDAFESEGMESLFGSDHARHNKLPPAMRRLIVDLKAEHPGFNLNEIANIIRAAFGRKPDVRSVKRVLDEEPLPLKILRNYPPYHEAEDPAQGRAAKPQSPGRAIAASGQTGCVRAARAGRPILGAKGATQGTSFQTQLQSCVAQFMSRFAPRSV